MPARMETDEYLKLAEVEDRMWYFRALHALVGRAVTREAKPAARVLDAGCGTGGLLLRLRQALPGCRFSGIDFMPLACELARRRCGAGVEVREASVTALPFAEASFDIVTSADVVCQIDRPSADAAIAEFFRVLRPGGFVVINVPAYMWLFSYHDVACHTRHRFTRPELEALLGAAGFVSRRLTHWNALLFPVICAKRKWIRREGETSDVKLYPAPLEAVFNGLLSLERGWIGAGGNWAWGSSIFAVARKPEA